jgi:N-acetyl-gamma-glutamyl-phosphate reductase
MTKVAVLGATGYTALELIQILLRHPHAEIVAVTSRQEKCPKLEDVHPSLRGRLDLRLELADPQKLAEQAECVFSCLPHAASAEMSVELLKAGTRVIDFSADYRLDDAAVFLSW